VPAGTRVISTDFRAGGPDPLGGVFDGDDRAGFELGAPDELLQALAAAASAKTKSRLFRIGARTR
jgi:hypothetical protein